MDSRLSDFLARAESVLARLEPLLPAVREAVDWERSLAARWHRDGRSGYLQPLEVSLDLRLADLLGVERQREQLERNTRQFVAGQPANHALLWGARGTGKSSLVRALLAELAGAGLRLIEIERDHLADLPRVVEQLQGLPQRFVLFCDDLSFDAGEGDYRVLKSVLDGSLEQAPENVLLYATSNRRPAPRANPPKAACGRSATSSSATSGSTRTRCMSTMRRARPSAYCTWKSTPSCSATTSSVAPASPCSPASCAACCCR